MDIKKVSGSGSNTMAARISSLFIFLCALALFLFLFLFRSDPISPERNITSPDRNIPARIRVYVADLPRSLNYGLLDKYWSLASSDSSSRIGSDVDNAIRKTLSLSNNSLLPYPENPIIKQYSAEYWISGDLFAPQNPSSSLAQRVSTPDDADVIFVPFFATLSAELQLVVNKGVFRKKVRENEDYMRQRMVLDLVKNSPAWKRSGGRDHVFVLTDPVAMWHVKEEIAPAILLVVDFGGWYKVDAKTGSSNQTSSQTIHHTQVSLLKDVIVPYTHLLPRLLLSENRKRRTLVYFKGAKHRHRGGLVREKLWDLLVNEPEVVMEEGFPDARGKEQSIQGMRTSEFCLHPAGDTPTSCRLFDAIQSLCIPVVVSDEIELPFEGIVDYSEFSVFVAVNDALKPNWLVNHLRSFSDEQKNKFRRKLAEVQPLFDYDNGRAGGISPALPNGAVNHIWRKVQQKLPLVKEAIIRERRKPSGVVVPSRCHCT